MLRVILSDYHCAFEGLFDTSDPVVAAEMAANSTVVQPGQIFYPLNFDDVLKEYEDSLHEIYLSIYWDTTGHSMPRPLLFGVLGSRGLGPKQLIALLENQETMLVFVRRPELNTMHFLVER